MTSNDWYLDPPEEQAVIALQHKKCGKFVKMQVVSYVPPTDPKDEFDEGHYLYHCTYCKRDVPGNEIRVIEA